MNDRERAPDPRLSIAAVERDTGVSKDTLRVWERRYGFPRPERDPAGDRVYPPEQVERLRTIRRLMDAGHRPGRIVALPPEALQALADAAPAPRLALGAARALDEYVSLIGQHDVHALRRALEQGLLRLGLVAFVTQLVAPLNAAVGEAWMQGRLQVFEEHLYTECVTGVLRHALAGIAPVQGPAAPRVLLTTVPNEAHGLGLLMVEVLLALEGCHCLSLGPQTPLADIVRAAEVHRVDIVALSFTAAQGSAVVTVALRTLRRLLPPRTALWVGGQCPVLYRRPLPGVLAVRAIESVPGEVARWRSAAEAK